MMAFARRFGPSALVVLGLVAMARSAAATEIPLSPCDGCLPGEQTELIEAAIQTYDVVSLAPGTYWLAGALTIDKGVTLRAADPEQKPQLMVAQGAPFVIDAPGATVRIENLRWLAPSPGRIERAEQVWVRGCEPAEAPEGETSLLVEGGDEAPNPVGELHIENCVLSGVPPLAMFNLRGTKAFVIGNDLTATGYSHVGVVGMGIDMDSIDAASTVLIQHNWIHLAPPTAPWRGDGVDYAPSVLAFLECLAAGSPACTPLDPISQWGACFLGNGTGEGCTGVDQLVVGVLIGNAMFDPLGQPSVWNVTIGDLDIDVIEPLRLNLAVSVEFCHGCTLRDVRHPATESYDFSSLADLSILALLLGGQWNYPWLAQLDVVDADFVFMQSEASTLIDNASDTCRVYDTSDNDNSDGVYDGDNLLLGRLSRICQVVPTTAAR